MCKRPTPSLELQVWECAAEGGQESCRERERESRQAEVFEEKARGDSAPGGSAEGTARKLSPTVV